MITYTLILIIWSNGIAMTSVPNFTGRDDCAEAGAQWKQDAPAGGSKSFQCVKVTERGE